MIRRRPSLFVRLAVAIAVSILARPASADLLPTGPSREADTTSRASDSGLVAMTPNGESVFLINIEDALKAITYDADGVQKGPAVELGPLPVGSVPAFFPEDFAVAPSGSFVIVGDNGGAGYNTDIFGQRFASDGAALGTAFQVNSYTTALPQRRPEVAVLDGGGFVVVWERRTLGAIRFNVAGQRFDSEGEALGTEFVVNASSINYTPHPQVAASPGGGFLVVWRRRYQPEGRLFDAAGMPVGNELEIGTSYPTSVFFAEGPSVAQGGGTFVVTWRTGVDLSPNGPVVAQRLDSSGAAIGTEFRVSSEAQVAPSYPRAAAAADGSFVITWNGSSAQQSGRFPVAQHYEATGSAVGGEFVVAEEPANVFTSYGSAVGMDSAGNMVVSWLHRRNDSDLAPFSLYTRRYCNDTADADSDTIDDCADLCAGFDDTADADGDGIPDDRDRCAGSAPGQPVDDEGCTIPKVLKSD